MAATFLTSFADYQRSYGSYYVDSTGTQAYLAYAVEGFFLNGGQGCWVARVASATAGTAQAKLTNITISAAGPVATGGQIGYQILPASMAPTDTTKFQLQLFYWPDLATAKLLDKTKATIAEVFDNLSTSPTSSMYFVGAVNSGSNLVQVGQPAVGPVAAAALALIAPWPVASPTPCSPVAKLLWTALQFFSPP